MMNILFFFFLGHNFTLLCFSYGWQTWFFYILVVLKKIFRVVRFAIKKNYFNSNYFLFKCILDMLKSGSI